MADEAKNMVKDDVTGEMMSKNALKKLQKKRAADAKKAEKKAKESREAQNVLSRASWERSGATSFDFGGPWGRVGGVRGWTCPTSPTSSFGAVGP